MTKEQALKACARVMMLGSVVGCGKATHQINVVYNNGDKDTITVTDDYGYDPYLDNGCVAIRSRDYACNVRYFTYTTVKP